jgi:outer membrane receptor protein involved in Fe transport
VAGRACHDDNLPQGRERRRRMRRSTYLRTGLFLVLGAVLLLVAPVPGMAQTVFEGTITGTVVLATGEVMPGAAIKLTSPVLVTGERTATSDERGRFVFLRVPPGEYVLSVTLQGFKTANTKGIVVERGVTTDVPVTMELGGYEEQVTVTSETPVVDTRSSTISTTFSDKLLAKVPTSRDPFYDLVLTAPGMGSVGAEQSWLPSPSAYGSANSQNIMLVNGVNTTNPRGSAWGSLVAVNYNTVEEVKVLSLGAKAEYGNYSGAAIDVITKSGGNEYHGNISYYSQIGNPANNQPRSAGASWLKIDPSLEITWDPQTYRDPSITLGGPIMRDKLWFYVGYDKPKFETRSPLRTLPDITDNNLYDLKLTGEFGANHRAWLGLHYEDTSTYNTTWGNGWDASMVYDSQVKNFSPQFQYQWVASSKDVVSVKYLGFDSKQDPWTSGATGHPGYINWWKWLPVRDMGTGGDFPYIEAQKSKRNTFQADVSHYAEDFLGEHDLKFGVQYTRAEGNYLGGYFQGYANFAYPYGWYYSWAAAKDWPWNTGSFWFNCSVECWPMYNRQVKTNPYLTVRKSDSTGVFADDTWVVNDRFTVNLGLRYDKMTAGYGTGKIYEPFQSYSDVKNPTVLRDRSGAGTVFDFRTWSPRLGIAWTATEDRKTVLRAHYGRYYAAMGVESLRRLGPDLDPFIQDTWLYFLPASVVDLNGNGKWDPAETPNAMRALAGRTPDMNIGHSLQDSSFRLEVAPGTRSPYTDQFNVSVQRQLATDLAIEFTYIYKAEKDLLAFRPYDTGTGLYYEWEASPFTTWTGYQTQIWQIVPKDYTGDGVIDAEDMNYVGNHIAYRTVNASSFAGKTVDRTYHGLQLVLNKRLSHRWQAMAAINWNKTDGFYPRVVDQNWYIDGPLVMDTPFGSSLNHYQNNLSGPALMTPEWAVKIAGSYTIPTIETDLGVRIRYDSGRPIWPVQTVPTWASWMSYPPAAGTYLGSGWNDTMVATDPNKPDWLPSSTILDLSIQKSFQVGNLGQLGITFDTLNVFNSSAPDRVVYTNANYGLVSSVVLPRTYRLGVKFSF